MNAIWKFEIEITDEVEILMPKNANVLTVQMQGTKPFIWAEVDTREVVKEMRYFTVVGTGHIRNDLDGCIYIGTFQMHDGTLVFHLYEKTIKG